MKKFTIWLPAMWLFMGAVLSLPVRNGMWRKPAHTRIAIAVYKTSPYASAVYNNTSAQLSVRIEKLSGKKLTPVWDKTFEPRLLGQYPTAAAPLSDTIFVPAVYGREQLKITYTVTYNSGGARLQIRHADLLTGKGKSGDLHITI